MEAGEEHISVVPLGMAVPVSAEWLADQEVFGAAIRKRMAHTVGAMTGEHDASACPDCIAWAAADKAAREAELAEPCCDCGCSYCGDA